MLPEANSWLDARESVTVVLRADRGVPTTPAQMGTKESALRGTSKVQPLHDHA